MIKISTAVVLAFVSIGSASAANPDAGKEKSRPCAACHGADGNSAASDFPRLAGQHSDYLLKSLKDYKSGARKNPIMQPQVANLSVRDMEDIAAYYAKQPGLITRKHAYIVR
jgi:cytochrome c553